MTLHPLAFWTLVVFAWIGAGTVLVLVWNVWRTWQRVRHHQQVTEEWRAAHLDPNRRPDDPFR